MVFQHHPEAFDVGFRNSVNDDVVGRQVVEMSIRLTLQTPHQALYLFTINEHNAQNFNKNNLKVLVSVP